MKLIDTRNMYAKVGRTYFVRLGSKPRHLLPHIEDYSGGAWGFSFLLWELFVIIGDDNSNHLRNY